MTDPAIPPMPELPAWILKHEIRKYPSFSEAEVVKRARNRILNRRGGRGQFLTENAKYWIARMQGGGGVGKNSVLPIGHTTMDKQLSWREGFRTEGEPVIIPERDYPGLELEQVADLFAAQAVILYRTETRGSNIGPDITSLGDPEPLTAINMGEDANFDLLLDQRRDREAYATAVLRSIHYSVPSSKAINFNSTRGRLVGLHQPVYGSGTENVGLALPLPEQSQPTNLVCIEVVGTQVRSPKVLLERAEMLGDQIEREMNTITMLCSKGNNAYIYIAGGALGGVSYNDVYDRLAVLGKLIGSPAPNSKVAYKDIDFKNLGIKVSRESFTRRNGAVLQLPMSLDIAPSKEKESMSKAYEGSHRLGASFDQSGLAIVPVANPDGFDPGYDDHPKIAQYRMNELVPSVIDFLRVARVGIPQADVEPLMVTPGNEWQLMRAESARVKEAKQEDLEAVNDAFCIPKGREVVLIYDGERTVMQVSNELAFTGVPQTNDFTAYCKGEGIESIVAKAVLTPTDGTRHSLIDAVVQLEEFPEIGETISMLMPLEAQVYGVLDSKFVSPIRGLAFPHAKFVRNISTETEGTNFAELITDELDSGYATRILLSFLDEEPKNLYSEQVLDAAVIGFDLLGKNPTNGMIGKVVVALLSVEKIKVEKGGKRRTIKAEMYNPIGVIGAFAGFDADAKRRIFEHLSAHATHPGYDEGYMLVNPQAANLVVRVMHKGVLSVKEQPRYRLITEMKEFRGPKIPTTSSPLDRSGGGRGVPTDPNLLRLDFGGRPERTPGVTTLEPFDMTELPIMRSPTITSIVTEVDGFEDHFVPKDDTYSSRYSEMSERLTFTAPKEQLPFNNPLAGPEPILDEAYEGPMDVQTLLTMSINPPTENWSAHRQRVPWDFAPNAFGRGSAFRTFKMDDPTSRRKAIHMDGWNRRYDKYKGVQAIAGRLLNGKWHIQSIRVPRHYGLRRTLKEVRLDRKRPPKWYKELHPEAKPFGTKKNPPKEVPRFLYHGSPVGGLKVLEPRVDPVLDAMKDGQSPPLIFLSEEPFEVEWYALGGYQAGQDYLRSQGVTRFTQLDEEQSEQFRAIIRDAWENPTPGYIYKVETTGKDIERIDASFENRAYISKEPLKVIETQKITQYTMENPILPRDYIKAMDEGWTGFPSWAISPEISMADLQGNPPWREEAQKNPYIMMIEPFSYTERDGKKAYYTVPIDEKLAPLVRHLWDNGQKTWYSDSGRRGDGYMAIRQPFAYAHDKLKSIRKDLKVLRPIERRLGHMKREEIMLEVRWHGLDALKKIYKAFGVKYPKTRKEAIELSRPTQKPNPPKKTPGGKTIPKRYLQGLTKEEMQIAIKEIDKGYEYDIDDPKAYEYWKSDIKATARGYKTVPSKYKQKFIEMYGPLPKEGKFVDKIAKATGINKRILRKVYDKGLAAWRTGHRPGVRQHQWAAGRVYSFVTLGNTVIKDGEKEGDYSLAIEAGLIKEGDLLKNPVMPTQKFGSWQDPAVTWDHPDEEQLHDERKASRERHKEAVGKWMRKNHSSGWRHRGDFKSDIEKKRYEQARAHATETVGRPQACSDSCKYCWMESLKSNPDHGPVLRPPQDAQIVAQSSVSWKGENRDVAIVHWNMNHDYYGSPMFALSLVDRNRFANEFGRLEYIPNITSSNEVTGRIFSLARKHGAGKFGPDRPVNYIEKVEVTPDFAGQGMSGELLNAYLQMQGYNTSIIIAESYKEGRQIDTSRLRGLYERYGFTQGEYYAPTDAYIMVRPGDDMYSGFTKFNPLKIITSDIITLSGRSGSGKSTIAKGIAKRLGREARIVPSYMTRKKRPNEEEPKDGVFITKKKFKEMIKRGDFTASNGTDLWVLQENGHYYGRRAADFEKAGVAIVDVSFSGLKLMRKAFGDVYAVLIKSRMGDERNREILRRRGIHTEEEIERRVKIGSSMMKEENWKPLNFNFIASNRRGELDKNVAMISAEFRKARDAPACPLATQDLEVNTNNRDHAIAAEHIQYGPLNLNDEEYWERYAKKWNTTADVAKKSNCSNCIAFDISPRMKKCMPGETSDPEGELGYCWMHHFKCHSARTCNTWAAGGPIDLDKVSFDWQERNAQVKKNPPKEPPTLEEFREWVDLVNMKNKELKAFMDSDWFAVSGLTPKQAEDQGIKSGQDSFRAIIRMRQKLGLRGPKDYIKSGPRITKQFYELALKKWTGPDASVPVDDDLTDWGWMKRQLRFNKRASAFPYNQAEEKRKGPLVKKQKTQNKPSRRLLSLWVWGHDPWRWARKHGVERMPKCPDVPWVGMTEKRKYGKVPVLMGPKQNPKGIKPRKKCPTRNPCGGKDIYRNRREAAKAASNRYELSYYESRQCGPNIFHLTSRSKNNPPESFVEYEETSAVFPTTSSHPIVVAYNEGDVAGFNQYSVYPNGHSGKPTVFIESTWVRNKGKGLGRNLMAYLFQKYPEHIFEARIGSFAALNDAVQWGLISFDERAQAVIDEEATADFYYRLGFRPREERDRKMEPGDILRHSRVQGLGLLTNPPGTMLTGFQTDGNTERNNLLYIGGGKVVQAQMKDGEFEKHPTFGTRYKKFPRTDPDQKHFSPLPFIARKWKKSTFKSQPETDYGYWKEHLRDNEMPYTVTLKVDGEGTLAHFNGKETVVWNWYDRWRTGFHITEEITEKLKKQGVKSAKLMGELYAVDENEMMLPMTGGSRDAEGRSETVGSIIKTTGDASTMDRQKRIRWIGFDILELDGEDMQSKTFEERMAVLTKLLSTKGTATVVPHRKGKGMKTLEDAWNEWSQDPEFEGGVIRFENGKTFKVKGAMTADMAVIGYYYGSSEEREGRGGTFADWMGGLALAFMDEDGNYIYSGNVGTGFSHADRQELEESLSKQKVSVGPTVAKWNGHLLATDGDFGKHDDTGKGIMYAVKPSMIVEVEYRGLNWSEKPIYRMDSNGVLQQVGMKQAPTLWQPSFKRFRDDKELTPYDIRLSQVAAEGEGKWKKNPVKTSYTLIERTPLEIPKITVWPRWHTVADARKNPNHVFLFGDNDRRTGKLGQAQIRGLPNAFGIRTKHMPSTTRSSYYNDRNYEDNIRKMKEDFIEAIRAVPPGGVLVLPKDGLGTGLAELSKRAPKTAAWLKEMSEMLNFFATEPYNEAEVMV